MAKKVKKRQKKSTETYPKPNQSVYHGKGNPQYGSTKSHTQRSAFTQRRYQ